MSHFSYIQDLDVHNDVKANKVKPGEYFVLGFNFSPVRRSPDLTKAAQVLSVGLSVRLFYQLISEKIN